MKNPYYQPKPGVLQNGESALDRLIARGTVMGACGVAMRGQSRRLAENAGVTADEAFKEFAANLLPGVTILPSGTLGRQPSAGSRVHLLRRRRLIGQRQVLGLARARPIAQGPSHVIARSAIDGQSYAPRRR